MLRNLAATIGIALVTTLFLVVFSIPYLNRWAETSSYEHSSSDLLRAYTIRLVPLLMAYFLAGLACITLVKSRRPVLWAVVAVCAGTLFSVLFYSVSVSGRVPFRPEIELWIGLLIPLVGLTLGAGLACFYGRNSQKTI